MLTIVRHPTILLRDPFTRRNVYIDLQMADPILRMWQVGIRTEFCCQGDIRADWHADSRTEPTEQDGYVLFRDHTRAAEVADIILRAFDPPELWRDPHEKTRFGWRWQRTA